MDDRIGKSGDEANAGSGAPRRRRGLLPGRGGRRSPVYHPFVLILPTVLVLLTVVIDLYQTGTTRFSVSGGAAPGGEGLVVSYSGRRSAEVDPSIVPGASVLTGLDGGYAFTFARNGFALSIVGDGRRIGLVFPRRVEEYRVDRWPTDARSDPEDVVLERTRSLGDDRLRALDAAWDRGALVVVAAQPVQGEARRLVYLHETFGAWVPREVVQLVEDGPSIVDAEVLGGDAPVVAWLEKGTGSAALGVAVFRDLGFDRVTLPPSLADAGDCREIELFLLDTRVAIARLRNADGEAQVDVWSFDPAVRAASWILIGSASARDEGWGGFGLASGGLVLVSSRSTALVPLPLSGARASAVGPTEYFDAPPLDGLPRSGWTLILNGPALLALLAGIIEAIRRPILSEPPLLRAPAPILRRLAAFLVDALAAVAMTALLFVVVGQTHFLTNLVTELLAAAERGQILGAPPRDGVFHAVFFLVFCGLGAVAEAKLGATPGKRLFGLRVRDEAGDTSPGLWRTLARRFVIPVDLFHGAIICVFLNVRSQRLGDIVSRTMVTTGDRIDIDPSEDTTKS